MNGPEYFRIMFNLQTQFLFLTDIIIILALILPIIQLCLNLAAAN
jgi:hypothetical protein